MVRRDGLVKVLDFGLAKLEEWPAVMPESGPESAIETQAPTAGRLSTTTGMVMWMDHVLGDSQLLIAPWGVIRRSASHVSSVTHFAPAGRKELSPSLALGERSEPPDRIGITTRTPAGVAGPPRAPCRGALVTVGTGSRGSQKALTPG